MSSIRIEAVPDTASGQFLAEIYVDERPEPILRSQPAFASCEDFIEQVVGMCRAHFPDHFPFVDDPTIGV